MGDENTMLTEADARHLLRRTGFTISNRQLRRLTGRTRGFAASTVVRGAGTHFKPRVRYNVDDTDLRREVHDAWLNYMLSTRREFQEKLVLFWHDHFATSNNDVKNLSFAARQNQLLRVHGKGNVRHQSFKDFVKAVAKDGAMMDFLDTNRNTKSKPNENFARELMELFTLGVFDFAGNPNYTQDDIVQIARAFTGWKTYLDTGAGHTYGDAYLQLSQHDSGSPKMIFTTAGGFSGGRDITEGGTVAADAEGDHVIDILFEHRDTDGQKTVARCITRKLLQYLVNPDPPNAVVDEIIAAANFDGSTDATTAWQLAELLRAILVHDYFYAGAGQPRSVKWPAHYVVSVLRLLKMSLDHTSFQKSITVNSVAKLVTLKRYHVLNDTANGNSMRNRLGDMGQLLFEPPSVFGWDWETAWTNSGTLLARYDFAVALVQARGNGIKAFRPERLIDLALTDPGDIVDAVTGVLQVQDQFPAVSAERDALIAYLTNNNTLSPPLNLRDDAFRNTKLYGLFCLVVESPAFQLQ